MPKQIPAPKLTVEADASNIDLLVLSLRNRAVEFGCSAQHLQLLVGPQTAARIEEANRRYEGLVESLTDPNGNFMIAGVPVMWTSDEDILRMFDNCTHQHIDLPIEVHQHADA